ncbi:MAG: leucine--tRNA ligase [Candidatus Aenigmarchaeota archaeon]|nr:leucine--tRNA ligase [Candidatus Aenigmarchaeota archaeon]
MFIVDYKSIEDKWKKRWLNKGIFEANPTKRKKCFVTFPFPYVNGPLHLGHSFTATRVDVYARFKRMQGFNVLFPFGFHATGEPILGVAERLKKGDDAQKQILLREGISEDEIEKFKDPKYIVRFWQKRIENDAKNLGLSVDWRRKFTTIDPTFNRFIEWQYNYLKKKGYITQATHPVVWCPHCQSPTGDHDRLVGEGESPIEYVIIKFRFDDKILPAATLRPETVFGVTNIWIRPDSEYIVAEVDGEEWIITPTAIEKLKDQLHHVKVKDKIKGRSLVGKYAKNPVTGKEIIILPASFVDLNNATGVVMSVPAHAPYDWIALQDLKKTKAIEKEYGIKLSDIEKIEPIKIINTSSIMGIPAEEFCKQFGVQSQLDKEQLDKATNELYRKEFHQGVLNENTKNYANLKVSSCKKQLAHDFKNQGIASSIWELTGKVVCRCSTETHVKILENQWFLKFSDFEWKKLAKKCIDQMKFYPEEARKQFEEVVEWLEDKACARKSGLGTRLPWDPEWIVETLSDSVIYMAFYTIAHYINEHKIESHYLKDEIFDYVFFGVGNPEKIANKGITKDLLLKMREEFEYWYGQDMRGSAKELIPNHLTFSIFHHVAIWSDDVEKWPKAYTINGMQQMYGQKMSKSKGNYITIQEAIDKYSADAMRITLMDSTEGMDDPDWTEKATLVWKNKLDNIYKILKENYNKGKAETILDKWLTSRMQEHIKTITENLENLKTKSAVTVLHLMINDIQWYLRRTKPGKALNYALEVLVKCFSPFTPFICEEMWQTMGKKEFVSISEWPKSDREIDKEVLQLEEFVKNLCEDLNEVIKLAGKKDNLYLYVASPKEFDYYNEAKDFLKKEFGFKKVVVFKSSEAEYDPEGKAKRAKFGKPGIYLE